jgi:hypothetical protein
MTKYHIEVRRITRDCLTVEVEADNLLDAEQEAQLKAAADCDNPAWEVYDCDYWVDRE